jgi:HEAT repeat protein
VAKSIDVDQVVRQIAQLRDNPAGVDAKAELTKHLGSRANIVVAKAAEVAGALRLVDLAPAMETACNHFFDAEDKGCLAKTAIATVLNQLSAGSELLFLRGVRHVQMEAGWGAAVDVAGELRAVSGLALAALGSRTALIELSDLLMDSLPGCRSAAAHGIAHVGHESGALPLRVKLLAGDKEIEVIEECLAALAIVTPKPAVGFIERMLEHEDEQVKAAAAIALGSTRTPEGLAVLLNRWERDITPASRNRLLPGIAVARLPQALDFLMDLIEAGNRATAVQAITALAHYRHDAQVKKRIAEAVENRQDANLQQQLNAIFGT